MTKEEKNIIEKINNNQALTDAEKMTFINYSIATHSGKLEGMPSISTSCLCNKYCIERSKNPNLICYYCYSMSYCDYRKTLREKLETNYRFYTNYEIPKKAVPLLNCLYFRFESFGDLNNVLQVKNYFTIARVNKNVKFALWTKNPWIISKAIAAGINIPKNVKIIYSIPMINTIITKELYRKIKIKYPFVNAIFTVHEKQFVIENNIDINCGGKSCNACGKKCYEKTSRITLINELKK